MSDTTKESSVENRSSSNEISAVVSKAIADTDASLLDGSISQTRRLHQEQEKLQKEMLEHLSIMGLKFEDLSSLAQADINYIATLASTLGVSEPSLPKMLVALSEISNKQFNCNLRMLSMEDEEARLTELHQSQMTIQFQLKRLQEESRSKTSQLSEDVMQSREKQDFFQKKCSQYVDTIQTCTSSLQSNGFTEQLSHQSLVERRKKLDDLQAKVASLKTELEAFHNLPPNAEMAKIELEKAKAELRSLDEQITARANDATPFQY